MKVSIIINNYNYDNYLESAIQSALSQTHNNIELIIVDDGSTDSSRLILEKYISVAKIILKENGGQGSAFNAGFAASSGEWVMFLDADDTINPELIESVLGIPNLHNYIKVHWNLDVINAKGCLTGELFPPKLKPLSQGNLIKQLQNTYETNWPPTSGNIYNRKYLEQIFPVPENDWRIATDIYVNQLAPLYGEVCLFKAPLSNYRIHGNNLWVTSNSNKEIWLRDLNSLEKSIALLESKGIVVNKKNYLSFLFVELNVALFDNKYQLSFDGKRLQAFCLMILVWKTPHLSLKARMIWQSWIILYIIKPGLLKGNFVERVKNLLAKVL